MSSSITRKSHAGAGMCGLPAAADRPLDHSGVMACPIEQVTEQKYDLQFGTNVIGKSILIVVVH